MDWYDAQREALGSYEGIQREAVGVKTERWTLPCHRCHSKCEKVEKIGDCKFMHLDECIHMFHDYSVNFHMCKALEEIEGFYRADEQLLTECGTTKCPQFQPAIEFEPLYDEEDCDVV